MVTGSIQYLYESDKVILEEDNSGNQIARNIYETSLINRTAVGNSDYVTGYYLFNRHGDVTKLVYSTENALNNYYYDAFGKISEETENINNLFKYAGYQYVGPQSLYFKAK